MTTVTTEQVQHDLPELLKRVQGGETLVIEQGGEPVDTHLLLWSSFEPQRLSTAARQLLEDSRNDFAFSSASGR